MKQTIAIDFDGVIHKYSKGWHDGTIYDEPFEEAFETIKELMKKYNVFIFSTRNSRQIKRWIIPHVLASDYEIFGLGHDPLSYKYKRYNFDVEIIPFWRKFWNKEYILGITKRKLPAIAYIDDRAIKFHISDRRF
jgi:hypothetical protein